MGKPLVTIVSATYNQEKYVKETVQSLLSQTYGPLEIIISDDHSTDRTWEIINEEVDAYKKSGGIHKNIVLNRNEHNLGIALHSQKTFSLAHGELLVGNGGDDVSHPNRVERIVEEWERSGGKALAIYHGAWKIDANGRAMGQLGEFYFSEGMLGAVASYSRRVHEIYGPITESDAAEDEVYGNRALILDARLNIRENLLKYRVNVGVSSGRRNYRQKQIRVIRCFMMASMRQTFKDLETVKSMIGNTRYTQMLSRFQQRDYENQNWLQLWTASKLAERLAAFKNVRHGLSISRMVVASVLVLPPKCGDAVFSLINFIQESLLKTIFAFRRMNGFIV